MKPHGLNSFVVSENGSTSIMSLFLVMTSAVVGGLAIDYNKVMADRTQMQITTDAVAHAALYYRENQPGPSAISAALSVGELMMPMERYGLVLTSADVEFGVWDPEEQTFTAQASSKTAVRVTSHRTEDRGNSVANLLLRTIGFDNMQVVTQSVFATYQPTCFREGFVAEHVVDIQSNNAYFEGFCIHSNEYVSLNSNNYFEPGTIVSMPDSTDLDLPNSGFDTNDGLQMALRDGAYRLRILNKLPSIIASLNSGSSEYMPDYIVGSLAVSLSGNKIDVADTTPGRLHRMNCGGGGQVMVNAGTYEDMVLVTNCKLKFAQGVILDSSIFATTNPDVRSMNAASGLQLGLDDNCAAGGGSVLMTLGGVSVPADMRIYGSQILAIDDIGFSANANGIQGASMISYGEISGTSNMNMGFCNTGMEAVYEADYYRMVN